MLEKIFSIDKALFLLIASVCYAFATVGLALNWYFLLQYISDKKLNRYIVVTSYIKTVLAKYLPTNTLHFVGRHLFAEEMKVSQGNVVLANSYEIILQLFVSLLVVLFLFNTDYIAVLNGIFSLELIAAKSIATFFIVAGLILLILYKLRLRMQYAVKIVLFYVLFYLISSVIFYLFFLQSAMLFLGISYLLQEYIL